MECEAVYVCFHFPVKFIHPATKETYGQTYSKSHLEGTRLTFKTDIAFAVNNHPCFTGPRKYHCHSPSISAEWCTFTNCPWGRWLVNFAPEEESKAFENYRIWLHLFERNRYFSRVTDRFRISTQMVQWFTHDKRYDLPGLKKV